MALIWKIEIKLSVQCAFASGTRLMGIIHIHLSIFIHIHLKIYIFKVGEPNSLSCCFHDEGIVYLYSHGIYGSTFWSKLCAINHTALIVHDW